MARQRRDSHIKLNINLLQISSACNFYLNFALGPLLHVEDKSICISKDEKSKVYGRGLLGRGNKHIADRVKQQLFSQWMNEWMADDAQVCVRVCVWVLRKCVS